MNSPLPDREEKFGRTFRCSVLFLGLSIILIFIACIVGSGSNGRDWAFELPTILLVVLISLILDLMGVGLVVVGLVKLRGYDKPGWWMLAALIGAALAAVLVGFASIAASASV